MWKEYKETFDGVHASQRLKAEVLNMKREENATKRRRIPAAALAAAILVIALAGTAVGRDYWINASGKITVDPSSGDDEQGTRISTAVEFVPVEKLSDAVLKRAEQVDIGSDILAFNSWSEAEEYLGLEISNNARLDQMDPVPQTAGELMGITPEDGEDPAVSGNCLLRLGYVHKKPMTLHLVAAYREEDILVYTSASLHTDLGQKEDHTGTPSDNWAPPEDDAGAAEGTYAYDGAYDSRSGGVYSMYSNPDLRENDIEIYVTSRGLETVIISAVDPGETGHFAYICHFVKDSAEFMVGVKGEAADDQSAAGLALLKEILDAYV